VPSELKASALTRPDARHWRTPAQTQFRSARWATGLRLGVIEVDAVAPSHAGELAILREGDARMGQETGFVEQLTGVPAWTSPLAP